MKVEVESLDRVRKNVAVVLDEAKVTEIREEIYQDLKKRAKIKGFRPGKVPLSLIQSYYKDYIDDELKRKMVEETMGEALSKTDVRPVSEPRVEFLEEDDKHGYNIQCEVVPEFDLPSLEGIEVEVEKFVVTDDDVAKRLEALRQAHMEMVDREPGTPAEKGDFVMIRYEAFQDGKPVNAIKSESYPLDLSDTNLMPEFENGIIGMKAGEEKEIEVNFPEDYPDKNIAGKKIIFQVSMKEVKLKKLPDLNDDFAKDLGFEDMNGLRSNTITELDKAKEAQRKRAVMEKIADYLLAGTDIPVPERLLSRRVEMMVEEAKSRMGTPDLAGEEAKTFNLALHKQFEPDATKRIRIDMILAKIAEQQGLKVEEDEVDERLRLIAEESKRAYDYIQEFYEKNDLKTSLRSNMLQEKTLTFLVEKATVKEKE
jgi:trigger factor